MKPSCCKLRGARRSAGLLITIGLLATVALASPSGPGAPSGADPAKKAEKQPTQTANLVANKIVAAAAPADKKAPAEQQQDLFNGEEYHQIKPEEMTVSEHAKDIEPTISLSDSPLATTGGQQNRSPAGPQAAGESLISAASEPKSAADEQLNAHLAGSNSLVSLESRTRPYAAPAPRLALGGSIGGYPPARPQPRPNRAGPQSQQHPPPPPGKSTGGHYSARGPRGHGPRGHIAPGYEALRGRFMSGSPPHHHRYRQQQHRPQVGPGPHRMPMNGPRPYGAQPRPAMNHPAQPQQGPGPYSQQPNPAQMQRYLPRGAAAGYAAFREFVRAQANRYKQQQSAAQPHESMAYNAAPSNSAGQYHPEAQQSQPPPSHNQAKGTKVSVAQAYIPHLTAPAASDGGKSHGDAANYQQQSPQQAGKPEYSKDFGMVIHYPQASIYTEPMTLEQVHKLTGSGGIGQVLEQLQHNLANGHRDESSMIRPDNRHHLGHGFTIHAKEYLAPGKTGHYVPTTAAVISSASPPSSAGYGAPSGPVGQPANNQPANYQPANNQAANNQPANYQAANNQPANYQPAQKPQGSQANAGPYQPVAPSAPQQGPSTYGSGQPSSAAAQSHQLGVGYERVKAAAANSAANSKYNQPAKGPTAMGVQGPQPYVSIGSELEAIYGPEVGAHIQSFSESAHAKSPLKFSEHNTGYPLALMAQAPRQQADKYNRQAPRHAAGQHNNNNNHMPPRRPNNHYQADNRRPGRAPPAAGYQQRPQLQPYRQHSEQHNQQAYGAAEQALNQQMAQILNDFNLDDQQYGSKGVHNNQGYPSKLVAQKQYQQQQQQPQPQQAQNGPSQYNLGEHFDGLELPHGPEDHVGEISELVDALKGTLDDSYKAEAGDQQQSYQSSDSGASAPAQNQAPSAYASFQAANPYPAGTPAAGASPSAYDQVQQQQHQSSGTYQQQQQVASQAVSGYQHQPTSGEQAYGGQQQQQQQLSIVASDPSSGAYGPLPPPPPPPPAQEINYNSQPQQQQPAASSSNYQSPTAAVDGQQQQAAAYGQTTSVAQPAYGSQQQQPQQLGYLAPPAPVSSVSSEQQQPQQLAYLAPPAPVSAVSNEQQQHQPQAQAQSASYVQSDHSQVIDHLVSNVGQQSAQPAAYESASSQQQAPAADPVNQISVAAPTESQYQSAQPLSSFVDSLPTEYQDFLRQPAGGASSSQQQVPHEPSSVSHEQQQQLQYQSAIDALYAKASEATAADILKSAASSQVETKSSSKSSSGTSSGSPAESSKIVSSISRQTEQSSGSKAAAAASSSKSRRKA